MHRAVSIRVALALCLLLALVSDSMAAFRFQALLDGDRNPATGCTVQVGASALRGHEIRVLANTDRSQLLSVVHEICRAGVWQEVARSTPRRGLGLGAGSHGGDLIRWSLPVSDLAGIGGVDLRITAEHTETGAADVLAQQAMTLAWGAAGLAEVQPIPLVSPITLLVLAFSVLLLARVALGKQAARRLAACLVIGLLWLPQYGGSLVAPVHAGDPKAVAGLTDPANDHSGFEPGVDLLHAEVTADASGMRFLVEVNNIEDDVLPANARVLFLGNSLTYSNRLPEMLQAIARQAGRTLVTEAVTQGGVNLDDLYRDGDALREIASGRYQRVIMQQGPSSLPESQEDLRLGALQFNPAIRASGARPALYMVWPDITRRGFFDDVRESYSNAALAVDGMFIPAGEAWRAAWRVKPSLQLYASDQFHPSELGSYAAALSMFAELYRQTPVGLPATLALASGRTLRFDPADALIVQQAAWEAHLQYGRAGR